VDRSGNTRADLSWIGDSEVSYAQTDDVGDRIMMHPFSMNSHVRNINAPRRSPSSVVCQLLLAISLVLALGLAVPQRSSSASTNQDRKTVARLDTEYQAAVKTNDADSMARILADDFVLVTASGKTYTKADMLEDARKGDVYEHNEEDTQSVRVWGDTAVVTARLWERYKSEGITHDHKFWFSDTYVRTPAGWKDVFGQSSAPPCP
jgi:ketosteroid isomerase-like protein